MYLAQVLSKMHIPEDILGEFTVLEECECLLPCILLSPFVSCLSFSLELVMTNVNVREHPPVWQPKTPTTEGYFWLPPVPRLYVNNLYNTLPHVSIA